MIPLVDLKPQHQKLRTVLARAMDRVIKTGAFIHGKDVREFEQAFARFCGTRYCVGVGTGTDALIAALRAVNVGTGDEVIIPAFTFVSTAFAVLAVGARPILVDVDPVTLTMNPVDLPHVLTRRTRAILPVHLYGMPAHMDEILRFAKKHHLFVIEDAAQAHGSIYRGKSAGSMGTIGCFSFYPSKNLGALGDGGAVVTNSARVAQSIRIYGNIGTQTKYRHTMIGVNSRLDTVQAAVLHLKLTHLNAGNTKRRAHAKLYRQILSDLPIVLPQELPDRTTNYHLFVIRTKDRSRLRRYLSGHGIETGIHYPTPLHRQPALRFLGYQRGSFPVSEKAAKVVLSLPMYPELTARDIRTVATAIHMFFYAHHNTFHDAITETIPGQHT